MKNKLILIWILCLLLCSCAADPDPVQIPTAADPVQADTPTTPADKETVVWPNAEEIRSTIKKEQTTVYWLADTMQIPDQITCYNVTTLDLDNFLNTLSEKLKNAAGVIVQ